MRQDGSKYGIVEDRNILSFWIQLHELLVAVIISLLSQAGIFF